jgi:hypothetical protein
LASVCFKPDQMGMVLVGDLKGRELTSEVWSAIN